MAVIQGPIVFCAAYQSCGPITVEPPFGLPPMTFNDPCCKGIDTLVVDLNQMLAPVMPFLTVMDCLVKLTAIVTAIPDSIGPPPDIGALASIAQKVKDFLPCIGRLISLAPLPVNIVAFARFIRDLARVLIAILRCLQRVVTVFVQVNADQIALDGSSDPSLQAMGICLADQSAVLGDSLLKNMSMFTLLINFVNQFIGILIDQIPALKKALEEHDPPLYPIVPNFNLSAPPVDTSVFDPPIEILTALAVVADVLAGGS